MPPLPEDLVGADLRGRDLRRFDLSGRDLSRADLSGANLSESLLTDAQLSQAVLRGTNLHSADMTRAELLGADLSGANLSDVKATQAGLGHANLSGANLFRASLEHATLSEANLRSVDLRGADLRRCRLRGACLRDAIATKVNLREADLFGADVTAANFGEGDFRGARLSALRGFSSARFVHADVVGVDFTGGYLVRRHIVDQNYLHEFRGQSRSHATLYWLWWVTSDCGRSALRWSAWVAAITLAFGAAYGRVRLDYGDHETWLSPYYYSLVTLTTLGYGDVTPASVSAQMVAMAEAVAGYVMLGGLLTILANKMGRRGD